METRKSCAHCKATKTPLWRTGPAGPRSLCNACGIRYRKRKATDADPQQQQQSCSSTASVSSHDGESIELRLMDFGRKMMIQTPESPLKKQRNSNGGRLGEVEEAAFLLLSLSCDPVFA